MRSMTAYGRHTHDSEYGELTWELRSVNHRYLEVMVRMPEELRVLEPQVRAVLAKRLSRGKVEANFRLRASAESQATMMINSDTLSALSAAIDQVNATLSRVGEADPIRVLQWPGVVATDADDQEPLQALVMRALDTALDDFLAAREREGEKTAELLRSRGADIGKLVDTVRKARPAVVARQKDKLMNKLAELNLEPDSQRLEQEIVFAAQRLDIDEELDRLDAHIGELEKALTRKDAIGRRLDFLMQEFNREANTLGAKAADADTTGASVDIKVLIEQMREQVQNIE